MDPIKKPSDEGTAPFNMALFTLEKIHNLLKMIAMVSAGLEQETNQLLGQGKAQHIKCKLVKQLYIQCVPLLDPIKNKQWKVDMLKRIREIKPLLGKRIDRFGKFTGSFESFSSNIEDELDDVVIEIQERLQEEKYFMPPKNDPRFSWKQD